MTKDILQWLSPLEPQQRHRGVQTGRLGSVGNWVLETTEFRKWRDGEDGCVEPVLFCYGNPGVGKTYVSSLVIDGLCDWAVGKDVAVVGLYCDFHAQQDQSTTNMLGAILNQLSSRGGIPEHTRRAFQEARIEFGGRGLQLLDMVDLLKKTIRSIPRLFICIDAVDECTPKHRRELLESLREIVRVSPGPRIFLTGRPQIDDEIVGYLCGALRIPLSPTYEDVMNYLEMRLHGDTNSHAMDKELGTDIRRIMLEKMSESFLLISLNMDAILGEITLTRRREKLDEVTKGDGLGGIYTATLSRIKTQQGSRSRLGMGVLMWVSHAERPLRADELCPALGVEGSIGLDIRNIPAIETLLECSLGLVTVESSSSTVRLVHYTLQEHLFDYKNSFPNAHSMIAEVCLTYLNSWNIRGLSPALPSVPQTAPFVEYASRYWGTHARLETTERVKTLALRLLYNYDKHISSKVLLLHGVRAQELPFGGYGSPRGFTGLHGAAYFGCLEIAVAILEAKKGDVQATDPYGNTAIAWASRRGHEEVVRVLLKWSDVRSNTPSIEYGSVPLLWAAENGHEGVVKILLERNDVNPDKPDEGGRTPLLWASKNGHEGVVKTLLKRSDVNPDKRDFLGRTPLSRASQKGHQGVVRMLLERNQVSPDKRDFLSMTPLLWASQNGREGVVRILLERDDVNPDKQSWFGLTPLLCASENRHEEVVKMLLERNDVNPDKQAWFGLTPLLCASEKGYEGVVKMLLQRTDVNPDQQGLFGQTPLMCASNEGHEGVVKILLGRKDVNPDKQAWFRLTPLLWASGKGHEGVVKMLLQREDVNPNRQGLLGLSPLSWASRNGHEGIVRMLLQRKDTNLLQKLIPI